MTIIRIGNPGSITHLRLLQKAMGRIGKLVGPQRRAATHNKAAIVIFQLITRHSANAMTRSILPAVDQEVSCMAVVEVLPILAILLLHRLQSTERVIGKLHLPSQGIVDGPDLPPRIVTILSAEYDL